MRIPFYQCLIAAVLLLLSRATAHAAIPIVMVTDNSGWLSGNESGRKSEMENFGYQVSTIWDGAAQATFNAAFAVNRAVYVPDEANSTELAFKLREATIGVVSEHPNLVDELGLCTAATATVASTTIDITNNTHYVTNVFATGAFSLGRHSPTT